MRRCTVMLLATLLYFVPNGLQAADPQLAHMVYFQLTDDTPATRERLVKACQKYLSGHDGTIYFSVGVLAADMNRDVNDRDFDVALHAVFRDRAAHDRYQSHARHVKFIEENSALWSKVRVFDSYLTPSDDAAPGESPQSGQASRPRAE